MFFFCLFVVVVAPHAQVTFHANGKSFPKPYETNMNIKSIVCRIWYLCFKLEKIFPFVHTDELLLPR